MKADKTVVIGLDGAHFELIEPWLENGDLPNIKRCMEDGIYADMEVCLPPVTSPNWKCYSTGKNPAELGIFWWENLDKENGKSYYPSERKHEHKEIWDYLSDEGYKVCVIGTPLTYPPKEVNGVMISGGLDCEESGYTYPEELEKRLGEEYNYRIHPKHNIEGNKDKAVEEMHSLIESRFEVARDLMEENDFDFVQITTFYINVLQHFLWDGEATKKAWEIVDKGVGKLLEMDQTNLIFMSDHGSNKIETTFNINTWLQEEGYLETKDRHEISKVITKLGFNKENISKFLTFFRLRNFIKNILPGSMKRSIPRKGGVMKKEGKASIVDWDKSDGIASGQGPIYILNDEKKNEIKEKLSNLKTEDGTKVLENIFEKEEIYEGEYLNEAPDLIMDQAPHIHISGSVGNKEIFKEPERWRAENKKYGLFIAHGPDFEGKESEDKISILDLAPTIVSLYGLEKSKKMNGKERI